MKCFWWGLCLLLSVACSAGDVEGVDSSASQDSGVVGDSGHPLGVDLPEYSNGDCPELKDGNNKGFLVGDAKRKFRLSLPENPEGAPVVFLWHWLGGNSRQAMSYLGFSGVDGAQDAVLVAPNSDGYYSEWRFDKQAVENDDLLFFDDMLRCLYDVYQVDTDRVFTTGMSAGGLWSSYLIIHRSDRLAAAAPLSGGASASTYSTPENPLPVMLFWGGESDTYSGFSFDQASKNFSAYLREDGHFVVECDHGGGHTFPPNALGSIWEFFQDHPKGVSPDPYLGGLPSGFPSYCSIPN